MNRIKSYIEKIKQWLFAGEEEAEPIRRKDHQPKKHVPDLEPVRMVHQYPKEGAFRSMAEEEQPPSKPLPKREKQSVPPQKPVRIKEQAAPKEVKPEARSKRPFKVQEIPSPIYGLELQRERVKLYAEQKKAETSVETEKPEEKIEEKTEGKTKPAVAYESFTAGERSYMVEKPGIAEAGKTHSVKGQLHAVPLSKNDREGTKKRETGGQNRTERINVRERSRKSSRETRNAAPAHKFSTDKMKADENRVQKSTVEKNNQNREKEEYVSARGQSKESLPVERRTSEKDVPVKKTERRKKPAEIQMLSTGKKKVKNSETLPKKEAVTPFNVLMEPADRTRLKKKVQKETAGYEAPGLHLLDVPPRTDNKQDAWAKEMSDKLDQTLSYFRVQAEVVAYTSGPSVTRFEIQPEPGVKINKIVQLTDDLKRSLAATEIRIEAPIPGKTTVGIEVPNPSPTPVVLRAVLRDKNFREAVSPLTVALGVDISGSAIVTDIAAMPHGLIAGTTGSGKSVCVNSMLTSILYKASPEEVRLLLIDPKVVELAPFNRVPHLAAPVITDAKEATAALKWAVEEMERRYKLFAEAGARDLQRYNKKAEVKLPQLVIVVDELADLMMVAPQEVEEAICRIAQKARACGIHLLVATQRPSVDVITGLIKANIPSRIAFSVSSGADSRTILDSGGAERLLGKGDMLFHPNSSPKPVRIQGTFVTDDEIDRVIDHVAGMKKPAPLFDSEKLKEAAENSSSEDHLFQDALDFIIEKQTASTSLLQRHFQIGYNRAARLIDDMEAQGVVSPARGSKARDVYSSQTDTGV